MHETNTDQTNLTRACKEAEDVEFPSEGEFFHYTNYAQFKDKVKDASSRIHSILTKLPLPIPPPDQPFNDVDDAHQWAVSVLDQTLEHVDDSLAGVKKNLAIAAKSKAAPSPATAIATKPTLKNAPGIVKGQAANNASGDGFVSYMNSKLTDRPQDMFEHTIDNSNQPFVHRPAINIATTTTTTTHPLHSTLSNLTYPDWQLEIKQPQLYRPFEETPFTYIDTVEQLEAAAQRIMQHRELAVDLEAHSHRSFQGFCCLMQLSTRDEDLIVDVIALRSHIGRVLAPIFADSAVVKVLHGSDRDIVWLQRDFGIYTCNLFDTGQAARVLGYGGHGLGFLLEKHCGFKSDKRFQLADWRLRPLSEQALHYARADTHFLLYCYDVLKKELLEFQQADHPIPPNLQLPLSPTIPSTSPLYAYHTVLERSRQLCFQLYEKELLTDLSFMDLYTRLNTPMSDNQLAVFAALYAWRDRVARQEDESTGYVLSRAQLTRLAQIMPQSTGEIVKLVSKTAPLVCKMAGEVLDVIKGAAGDVEKIVELKRAWRDVPPQQGNVFSAAPPVGVTKHRVSTDTATKKTDVDVGSGVLKPKTVKPVVAPAAGLLQPKTIKPLVVASSQATTSGTSSLLTAKPVVLKSTLGATTSSAFGQMLGGVKIATTDTTIAAAAPTKVPATAARALNPSYLLPTAGFVPSSAAGGSLEKGKDSVSLKKKAQGNDAVVENDAAIAEEGDVEEPATTTQEDQAAAVRAAMNQLAGEQQQQQAVEDTNPADDYENPDFLPLSLTDKYHIKGGKKRTTKTTIETIAPTRGGGTSKKKKRNRGEDDDDLAVEAEQRKRERTKKLKQKYIELGLEDAADGDGDATTDAAVVNQEESQKDMFDMDKARSKYDLGIINVHREEDGRGRGRGRGRGGRGRGGQRGGRGGGRFNSSGGGRGGRGGRRDKDDDKPRIPAGKFNPYASGPDVSGFKGGKRSTTHVRSGNKSFTYKN